MYTPIPSDAPASVRMAINFFMISVLLNIIEILLSFPLPALFPVIASSRVTQTWGLLLSVALLWLIIRRHNWARILFVVLLLLGILSEAAVLPKQIKIYSVTELILLLAYSLLQVITVFFLMKKTAKPYFVTKKVT